MTDSIQRRCSVAVKMFWRIAHRFFSFMRVSTFWISEKMLDCQVYCSRRTGWEPF